MNKPKITESLIDKFLNWGYSKAVTGFGGVDSAYTLADDYLKGKGDIEQKVDKLIKWQVGKATANSIVTGLGGISVLPLTLPANVLGVMYIQIRMIVAIAYMGGHDIKSDQVKSLVYICMVGNGAKEILKEFGIKTGEQLATNILKNISIKAMETVNKKVTSGIATKITTKGFDKLSKIIPVVGGVIGCSVDAASTQIIGKVAKRIFIESNNNTTKENIEIASSL